MAADIQIEVVDMDVSSSGDTYTLTHDVGSLDKAFVKIISGTTRSSSGRTDSASNLGPADVVVGVVLTATDTLTFYRDAAAAGTIKIILEVWRYVGSGGGAYEFIVRQRGTLTVLDTTTGNTTAISGVTDRNSCIPFTTGYTTTETSSSLHQGVILACHINSSTEIEFSRNNAGTGDDVVCYYEVVEFTGSAWSVGYGVSSAHDGVTETVTLNTDSTGASGSTFDVSDWGTAMIIESTMEGDSVETGLADVSALVRPETGGSTTQVEFSVAETDGSARNDGTAYIHVLKCADLIVSRAIDTAAAHSNGAYNTIAYPSGASSSNAISNMSLEWYTSSSGTGTAHCRGRLGAFISTGGVLFNDGEPLAFDNTSSGIVFVDIEFPASPEGCIFETGGTGLGVFVGYNDAGNLVARIGGGVSGHPSNCARVEITPATYDFANKSGILRIDMDLPGDEVTLYFDENNTGSWDYTTSDIALSNITGLAGTNAGQVGDIAGASAAGTEIVTTATNYNGVINELQYFIGLTIAGRNITNWIHRSGNVIRIYYGVADLTALKDVSSSNPFMHNIEITALNGISITSIN